MIGELSAIASSLSGGTSAYLSATTSRRIGTLQFAFCTQAVGLMLAGGWVAIGGSPAPGAPAVLAALGAGIGLMIGLLAFVQAMVVGTIAVVAPISAIGVVVPIAAGVAVGERPGAIQVAGIVAASAGLMLATRGTR